MTGIVFSIVLSALIYSVHGVLLKNSMNNNYPQVVVRGCESQKSNLFYDNERQVWMEDLTDQCRDDEEQILEFCRKVYSMLRIENIVQLDSPLSFGDWCELNRTETDLTKRCKIRPQAEAIQVKPIRCLHKDSPKENSLKSGGGCVKRILQDSSKCQSIEKWNQKASDDCSKVSLILSSELNTVDWCEELAEYSAVEFLCCPFGDSTDDTSEEQEDEPITEPVITEKTNQIMKDSKSRSELLDSDGPEWMKNEPNWPRDSAFFADDEDMADEQNAIPLSSLRRSNLTIVEHDRFTQEKIIFQEKYQAEIDKLKSQWRQEENADRNTIEEFRQAFETLKQRAKNEQRTMNELHENNLDRSLDLAKKETNQQIQKVLLQNPFNRASFEYWTYQYLHTLLRDRIHLVNRYERLQATDPEQAEEKRDFIHQRLNSISRSIDRTLLTLKENQKIYAFASPRIDQLIDDYQEVNSASERLLSTYNTESNIRNVGNPSVMKLFQTDGQDYDHADHEKDFVGIDTTKISLKSSSNWISDRDWILSKKLQNLSFQWVHFVYLIGAFGVFLLIIGIIIRCHRQFKSRNNTKFRSNSTFTPIESSTLEDKSLRDLQLNGYENPTYKYFEKRPLKC